MVLGRKNSLRRNLIALAIAWPWVFVAFARILSLDMGWPVIPLVAFIPQTLVTMLIPFVTALWMRARWTAIGIAVLMVWLVVIIAPRTFSHDEPAASGRTVHIFTANLKKGAAEPGPLLAQIRAARADIVSLQEAGDRNVAELRARGLMKTHPYVVSHSSDGTYANTTISRWPLKLSDDSFATTGSWPAMRVGGGGTGIEFYNFHSLSPTTPGREAEWSAGLGSLPAARGRIRLIAGDFNATVDHREFRAVLARGYVDAGYQTGNGLKWTWVIGRLTRLVIDHVLAPPDVAVESYRVQNLPGSDHKSVSVVLRLPR